MNTMTMTMNTIKFLKGMSMNIIYLLDILLIILVIFSFINDFFNIYFLIFDKVYDLINLNDVMCFMSNSASNASVSNSTQTTTTQIIHDDGS